MWFFHSLPAVPPSAAWRTAPATGTQGIRVPSATPTDSLVDKGAGAPIVTIGGALSSGRQGGSLASGVTTEDQLQHLVRTGALQVQSEPPKPMSEEAAPPAALDLSALDGKIKQDAEALAGLVHLTGRTVADQGVEAGQEGAWPAPTTPLGDLTRRPRGDKKRGRDPVRPGDKSGDTKGKGLDDADEDGAAIVELDSDKLANSSRQSTNARLEWWCKRAGARRLAPFPITPYKLKLAAALLKKSRFRSAQTYLRAVKKEHMRRGHEWSAAHQVELMDCIRSCERGLGPPKQASALNVNDVANLEEHFGDTTVAPRDAILVGCWWLLREVELANVALEDVSFGPGGGQCGKSAELNLPVSKTDTAGKGKKRCHGCACPSAACPVAALDRAYNWANQVHQGNGQGHLLTTWDGRQFDKRMTVALLRKVARKTGAQGNIQGHSMRVSGAQHLAKAGIDLWRVQVFGRWGSAAVLKYVRDSLLGVQGGGLAAEVELNLKQQSLVSVGNSCGAAEGDTGKVMSVLESQGHDKIDWGSRLETVEMNWDAIKAELEEFRTELNRFRRTALPPKCASRNGKVHWIATMFRTACLWEWSSNGGVPVKDADTPVDCKKCIRAKA